MNLWSDDASEHRAEWRVIVRRLDALYARQMAGDDSILTRQRVGRLEALQMALCGFPAALST